MKIKDLKEKIYQQKGEEYRCENQKLILLGKVLEDPKSLQDYGISEQSSIVCFATKVISYETVFFVGGY